MSIHRSLRSIDKLAKQRSVLKRFERLKKLMADDKWKQGQSVFGLPKIKVTTFKMKKGAKQEKPKEAASTTVPVAPEKTTQTKIKKEEK
ncbi:small basic protein [bacterium Unc6]|nr:small basic protein [bacterium Unc6]